jgi:spermidine synthase
VLLHSSLLILAALMMPIIAADHWRPTGQEEPTARILGLLLATIGLPYFLLATTTPLIGAWYWRRYASSAPYRLFALSNFASLLALLGFPFLIEPVFGNRETALLWSGLFVVFAVLCITLGWVTLKNAKSTTTTESGSTASTTKIDPQIHPSQWLLWVGLSAIGSSMLLGVSSHLTQNISSAPLLWVVPLALYLITFIISFDHPRWYARWLFLPLAAAILPIMAWLSDSLELKLVTPVYAAGLFLVCMVCHGELARHKPHPAKLTGFYLSISLGGALGSLAMAVLAPMWLNGYYELYGALIAAALIAVFFKIGRKTWQQWAVRGLAAIVLTATTAVSWISIESYNHGVRFMERDFYGVVRTRDNDLGSEFRSMIHGAISHGGQLLDEPLQMTASSYFGPTSGYGRLFASLPNTPRRVGVIGLGAGALAVYARPGDHWVFYEISPAMVRAANAEFSFLRQMAAPHEVVIGDGRLNLDREPPRQFDVLALDAFSGDSIPTHLITKEAMAIYIKHLTPDGVIVFQATNRFVDLMPVARNLADEFGLSLVLISDQPEYAEGPEYWLSSTDQIIMTRNKKLLDARPIREAAQEIPKRPSFPIFTDDYINLLKILKR